MTERLSDTGGSVALMIEEAGPSVDNDVVLAKVKGPFFFPGGTSRNQRYYPPELWEKALLQESVQQKIKDLTMYGTVFHPQQEPPIEEYSHVVTKLWVDPSNPKVGMGEALILNTPKGQILNKLLRLGSKWCVSSRATGRFVPGKTNESGLPIVDPETYQLQTFDFTPDPGFVDAHPQLVESLLQPINKSRNVTNLNEVLHHNSPNIKTNEHLEVFPMADNRETTKAMVEALYKEKKGLEQSLQEALAANESYANLGSPEELAKALDIAKEQNSMLKSYMEKGSVDDLADLEKDLSASQTKLSQYEDLGSPEEINAVFDQSQKALKQLADYKKMGTPQEIKEVYVKASKMSDILNAYKALGTPEKIAEAFSKAEDGFKVIQTYKEIGTVDEIQESYERTLEVIEELKSYKELGTPVTIKETFDRVVDFVKFHKMQQIQNEIPNLAVEFGLPESTVRVMVETTDGDEDRLRGALTKLRESSRNRVNLFPTDESTKDREVMTKSVTQRIAESLG
jgi:tetratricopeptide (TPR) repeat protein